MSNKKTKVEPTTEPAIVGNTVLSDVSNRINEQRAEQTQVNIKRLIQGAKVIDLTVLAEIISENEEESFFDISDNNYKVGQSLEAVKEFCTAIRNIR